MASKRDIYQEVTDRILNALEQGTAPWLKPWDSTGLDGLPLNASTGRAYNGINILLLWLTAYERSYTDSRWLTFRQAKALGGAVRKGEKGTLVTFWKVFEKKQDDGTIDKIPVLKHFTVFNVAQVDGLALTELDNHKQPPQGPTYEAAQAVLDNSGAQVLHGKPYAYYSPTADHIGIPPKARFDSIEAYWATLLHELTHWTSHPSRCGRKVEGRFGSDAYAREELVAEMGSAFLCAQVGVPLEGLQHDSYLDHWIRILQEDKRAIIRAASQARKASEFLLKHLREEGSQAA
jgi:antirestriction protein ArdC